MRMYIALRRAVDEDVVHERRLRDDQQLPDVHSVVAELAVVCYKELGQMMAKAIYKVGIRIIDTAVGQEKGTNERMNEQPIEERSEYLKMTRW
jgi:hypothetical protein